MGSHHLPTSSRNLGREVYRVVVDLGQDRTQGRAVYGQGQDRLQQAVAIERSHHQPIFHYLYGLRHRSDRDHYPAIRNRPRYLPADVEHLIRPGPPGVGPCQGLFEHQAVETSRSHVRSHTPAPERRVMTGIVDLVPG